MAVVLLVAGAALWWVTRGFPVVDWAPLSMAFWPRLLLACLGALALLMAWRGHMGGEAPEALAPRAFGVFGAAALYAAALQPLGWHLATPLFLGALNLALAAPGERRLAEALAVAAGGSALIWLAFAAGLRVPLPQGVLTGVVP